MSDPGSLGSPIPEEPINGEEAVFSLFSNVILK